MNPESFKILENNDLGLNIKKGIVLSGGKIEFYVEVLAVFYVDGIEKIKEINKCLENENLSQNLSLYITYIHGLKSAAAAIGANTLSDAAKALEIAGRQSNLDFIYNQTPIFLKNLEFILHNIHEALSSYYGNSEVWGNIVSISTI